MNPPLSLENLFAKRARIIPDTPDDASSEKGVIDFTFGHPDPNHFPLNMIRDAVQNVLELKPDIAFQYSDFRGSEQLLECLTKYLSERRHILISRQNMIVTNGSMQALGLMGKIFINPGDVVFVESPTYFRAVSIFQKCEAELLDIPIDENGIILDRLENSIKKLNKKGRRPKFLYTIPTYQNPTGVSISIERRKELLKLCLDFGLLILEDTAYNELWYDAPPPPTLFELDGGNELVVQTGTFSKVIAPGLSIGWAIGAKPIIKRFVEFKDNGGTTPFTAHLAAEFLSSPRLNQHLDALRKIYKEKRDTMNRVLKGTLDDLMDWRIPGGGYFVWLDPKVKIDQVAFWKNAINEKVVYLPGRYCYTNNANKSESIRLAFSCLNEAAIEEGVKRLNKAMRISV